MAQASKSTPSSAPPRLLGVLLGDLLFAVIWLLTGVRGLQVMPAVSVVFIVAGLGIGTLGFLLLTRKPVILMIGTVVNGLLTAMMVVSGIINGIEKFQQPMGGPSGSSYKAGAIAGLVFVVIIPLACAMQCHRAWKFAQQEAENRRRGSGRGGDGDDPTAAEDDFDAEPSWDENQKR